MHHAKSFEPTSLFSRKQITHACLLEERKKPRAYKESSKDMLNKWANAPTLKKIPHVYLTKTNSTYMSTWKKQEDLYK